MADLSNSYECGLQVRQPGSPVLVRNRDILHSGDVSESAHESGETSLPYSYVLRFAVQPGFREDEKLDQLAVFCQEARIDEVMFFINCEEINRGHLTREETRPWIDLIAKGKAILDSIGVLTSVNPWLTLQHREKGRELKPGQNFGLMVDPYGNRGESIVCPLCPDWQSYISDIYSYYATVRPHVLWVEDDFRLHNHEPLKWGGCFCDLHMAEYSRIAGHRLTRQEFVEGMLKPGDPHPYRKIWLDTGRETMIELARLIGDSVSKESPCTKVGLMSSSPAVHCAEGRDWESIFNALAGRGNAPVNRPPMPAYSETTARQYLWDFTAYSRLTEASVPKGTELYPELENYPHTRFSKSRAFMLYQIESSLVLGADGITLDIFDLMGNGVLKQEGYRALLAGSKDFLDTVTRLGLRNRNQTGVKVLFSPDSSYTIQTSSGNSIEEIYPSEVFWSCYLSSLGIANAFRRNGLPSRSVVAVSGQYFRNLSKAELESLFEDNFLLLDGEAAFTLFDMGQGNLAGIKNAVWHNPDSGFQAYEQVCDGKTYCGLEEARISCEVWAGDFLEIQYGAGPVLRTVVKNPFDEIIAAGMAVYDERVFVLPYGPSSDYLRSHLNPLRQEVIQSILRDQIQYPCPFFVKGLPYTPVYSYDLGDRVALLINNSSGDEHDEIRIHAPGLNSEGAIELNKRNPSGISADIVREGEDIVLRSGLSSLESKVIVLDSAPRG